MSPLPPLLLRGDCMTELARIPDESVDAVVTDPPYGLDFMGRDWDNAVKLAGGMLGLIATGDEKQGAFAKGGTHSQGYANHDGLAFEIWTTRWAAECRRILKPGGHLLAFGGSRTWHRLAAGIEDAGFEIRDSLAWLYGSGMPKSMDVSKAIDKLDAAGVRLERARLFQSFVRAHLTPKRVNEITNTDMGHHFTTHPTQPAIATADLFDMLRPYLPAVPAEIEALVSERTVESANYAARGSTGKHGKRAGVSEWRERYSGGSVAEAGEKKDLAHTAEAEAWQGWGTGLKPSFEPIVVARKPMPYRQTVAANVLEHGTGALNIDGARLPTGEDRGRAQGADIRGGNYVGSSKKSEHVSESHPAGRWPTNAILDEASATWLDAESRARGAAAPASGPTREGRSTSDSRGVFNGTDEAPAFHGDKGGASRFFYVAKAPKSERPVVDGTAHPTVKPLEIMRRLCRLVTPPGGVVVDPFAGSGTTLEAAYLEGFESIGVEMTPEYWPLIAARIERVTR